MIYILGVDHFKVQLPHQNNDKEKVTQFLEQVKNVCREKKVGLIAEEVSEDALVYQGIDGTHVAKIVPGLGIEYLLCDPGQADRCKLGIKSREQIALELSIPFPPATTAQEDRINQIAAEFDRWREKYWLDQIKSRNGANKVVLLICGFQHVDFFSEIARKGGYVVIKIN